MRLHRFYYYDLGDIVIDRRGTAVNANLPVLLLYFGLSLCLVFVYRKLITVPTLTTPLQLYSSTLRSIMFGNNQTFFSI